MGVKKRTSAPAEPKVLKRRKVDDTPPVWYVFTYLWGLPHTYRRGDMKEDFANSKVLGTTLGSKFQKELCLEHSGHVKFQLVIGHGEAEEVVRQPNWLVFL